MLDNIDKAQLHQLNQVKVILKDYTKPSLTECQECGNDIPPERQALGAITLCVECKTIEEKRTKSFR